MKTLSPKEFIKTLKNEESVLVKQKPKSLRPMKSLNRMRSFKPEASFSVAVENKAKKEENQNISE